VAADLLVADRLTRAFGDRVAVRDLSLSVGGGEIVALIGPNGAGKSTLLGILAGAVDAGKGRVSVGSRDGGRRPRVGWVPQRPAQYARLSARENLELFARLEAAPEPEAAVARLLRLLDLPDDGRLVAQLSVGNQQRLNLAIALLSRPDVLLLDEPTASLDPRQRRRLWEVASDVREGGGAVVFASQNLEEVGRFADRVVVLLDGALVFDGSLAEFARAPQADVFA
jgi:ABC-type multidrug transport system ATPase subunit